MKLTRHNGRSGKNGTYNPKHNDRQFDVANSEHIDENRTTTDLLKDKRTCPEESIYQIGNVDDHVDPELLFQVVTDFFNELEKRFGTHVHILDWALNCQTRQRSMTIEVVTNTVWTKTEH